MGMFDEITCEYLLPDEKVQNAIFQTKDFFCTMGKFTITKEGRIWKLCRKE